MRNLILCLMFGLIVVVAGCDKDDESNGNVNNNGGGGTFDELRNITLDHVDGSPAAGKISAGTDVVFYMRLKNASGFKAKGITNGFRIYSNDGATWNSTSIDTTGTLNKEQFDLILTFVESGVTGSAADTVGWGASIMTGPGMPDGFDDVAFTVAIGPTSSVGKHVCIDSSYYPPSGTWMWAFGGSENSHPPGWDGPHCFEVVP